MKTEEYLDYYYKSISFQGELQINAIKIIAEEKGQGGNKNWQFGNFNALLFR